jgi:hypothetical protein
LANVVFKFTWDGQKGRKIRTRERKRRVERERGERRREGETFIKSITKFVTPKPVHLQIVNKFF